MPNSRLIDVDLEGQLAALRKDMGALKRLVGRRSSSLYEDAGETISDYGDRISDYLEDLGGRIRPSLAGLRRQARTVERVAYDHPAVVAGVGLIVIGLVASLLISRRLPAEPRRRAAPPREAAERPTRRRTRATAH